MNICTIMGRLTDNLELRKTTSEVSVCRFTVAVDRGYQKDGERQTDWIDVVAWRGTAEFLCKYFGKGDMVAISGSVQTRSYEDKEGKKRKAVELVADKAFFCGKKNSNDSTTAAAVPNDNDFEEIGTDDDLPF